MGLGKVKREKEKRLLEIKNRPLHQMCTHREPLHRSYCKVRGALPIATGAMQRRRGGDAPSMRKEYSECKTRGRPDPHNPTGS